MKNRSTRPFAMVDQAVLMDENLTVHQKLIYAILCCYANWKDGSCFPSYQTMADKAGCSRSTAIRAVAKLVKAGYLEKKEQFNAVGDNTSNRYFITFFDGVLHTPPPDKEGAPPNPSVTPPDAGGTPKRYSNNEIQSNEIHLSITEEDRLEKWKQRIGYDYFEEEMPDKLTYVDSLLGYIFELEQDNRPELNRLLATVDDLAVLEFLEEIRDKSFGHVVNFRQYLKKMLIEFLREREITLAAV